MIDGQSALVRAHLSGPMSRGEVVLFTGAGFSLGARNAAGEPMPDVAALRRQLWRLVYGDQPLDPDSTLQEIFDVAAREHRESMAALLRPQLTVEADSVTASQLRWLTFPWKRAYTVNIDDLEIAASARLTLQREIRSCSAMRDEFVPDDWDSLSYIHLNGDLADLPDVTFSERQYGRRSLRDEALYSRMVADLNVTPVIFVGTSLREDPLWRHLELRRAREPLETGVQPRSYLVSPTLSVARQGMLSALNIEWVPLTSGEFATQVLSGLVGTIEAGYRALSRRRVNDTTLKRVSDLLLAERQGSSRYYEGAQPTWGDVVEGRAIERRFEATLDLDRHAGQALVTGTAGEGTSTALMRLAMRCHASGRETLWCDAKHEVRPQRLRANVRALRGNFALFIDDADMLGPQLEHLVQDVVSEPGAFVVMGMRSTRIDAALPRWSGKERRQMEIVVPPLQDSDIASLLRALETHGALGLLTALTSQQRTAAFAKQAGRSLLVAMIRVTEGEELKQKAEEEFQYLAQPQRSLYGVVALATAHRYELSNDEALQAAQAVSAEGTVALSRLLARGLVVTEGRGLGTRHRVVADLVVDKMKRERVLASIYRSLAETFATRLSVVEVREQAYRVRTRHYRYVERMMNHRNVDGFGRDDVRTIYTVLEPHIAGDYHFWLQRGSFEVRRGSLDLAQRYLRRAQAEGGDEDFRVQVEWLYMRVKQAAERPEHADAHEWADEAHTGLLELIDHHGSANAYPYHVLLSQYPKWIEVAPLTKKQKIEALEGLGAVAERAVAVHGNEAGMVRLQADIKRQYLMQAVGKVDRPGAGTSRGRPRQ